MAQGMPGEGLTHGPPATKKAGGSHHRISQIIRHSLRDGLRAYTWSPRGPAFLPPSPASLSRCKLGLSTGRPGPHDFTVRVEIVRRRDQRSRCNPTRPSHPGPTFRDDREAPLWSGPDARKCELDLPDGASATCVRQIGTTGKNVEWIMSASLARLAVVTVGTRSHRARM